MGNWYKKQKYDRNIDANIQYKSVVYIQKMNSMVFMHIYDHSKSSKMFNKAAKIDPATLKIVSNHSKNVRTIG